MSTKVMKYSLSIALASFFAGCGGGGGSSTTTTSTPSTYSVTGTVPGTIIEAYCNDGSFYSTTSTDNGTSEHPFTLTLPVNLDCKLVMITNETDPDSTKWIITPIEIESDGNTGTYLTINKDVNLGNINLETPNVNSWTAGVKTPLTVVINNQILTVKSLSNDAMDSDGDGIPNVYEDDDDDGYVNKFDDDDDNDGIKDVDEDTDDHDHDGIKDIYDKDDDNDGHSDDEDNDDSSSNSSISTSITLPSSFSVNDGRLLGSQCAQCHGTNGVSSSSFDSIRGEDNLYHEMYDDDAIMTAQAKGYTSTEAAKIESWLNSL